MGAQEEPSDFLSVNFDQRRKGQRAEIPVPCTSLENAKRAVRCGAGWLGRAVFWPLLSCKLFTVFTGLTGSHLVPLSSINSS